MTIRRTLLLVACLLTTRGARADIASDQAAALVVYPVIYVVGSSSIDTQVQLSNTSNSPVMVRCFYVNANGHCSNSGVVCSTGSTCGGGMCVPGWNETDFRVQLTARQPIAWLASEGLASFCDPGQPPGELCIPLGGTTRGGQTGGGNTGTHVPAVSEDPFIGELKCVVVDDQNRPVDRNVLVGTATIVQARAGDLDVVRDNAIGIPAVRGANNGDDTLVLGEEYASCPNTLIVNHFFDGASDPVTGTEMVGVLALVPCSEDFVLQTPAAITAQFLVFNEFEQRFSTSKLVDCFALWRLGNVDTSQAARSIFSVGVAGTLSGQTRITGVGPSGHGLLGAFFDGHGGSSTAANLHFQGVSSTVDVIRIP